MEHSSRIYARKILLAHVLALVVVLGVVALATRQVYNSARQQAIEQASIHQELLATQTGRGIESFYTSIISDLDLLRRAEPDDPASTTAPSVAGPVFPQPEMSAGMQGRLVLDLSPMLWSQLSGRVSAIFDYNRRSRAPDRSVRLLEPRPMDSQGGRGPGPGAGQNSGPGFSGQRGEGPRPDGSRPEGARSEGARSEGYRSPGTDSGRGRSGPNQRPDPGRIGSLFAFGRGQAASRPEMVPTTQVTQLTSEAQVLAKASDAWLAKVTKPTVSNMLPVRRDSVLQRASAAGGVNLVCVPVVEGGARVLVAVVPANEIQDRFLPVANERHVTSATLIDENLAVVASTTPALVGMNLKNIDDPNIRTILADFGGNPRKNTVAFDQPITVGGMEVLPRLVTVEPVDLPQTKWCLLIASPLGDVDTVVQDVFRTVLYWAAFLVISMTAILVSTAISLIRVRVRFERVQHEVLTRELSQARQIQLNWLPNRHSAGPALDIAAINHPASHISGDFYNWFDLPDGRQVITIGDVTGHGMAAAFLMATTQLLVRTTMPRVGDPGTCMEEVNRQLCTQVFHGQFVTMLIIVLDLEHSVMELATAGHIPPLMSEGGGPFTALPIKSQLVLAVDSQSTYPTERFQFAEKSSMLLYTDGVVDVQAENGARFDGRRLREILTGNFDSAQAIIDRIVNSVNTFRGKRELGDDLTLVAIQTQPVPRGDHLAQAAAQRRESVTVGAN
jgi:hypothetical protein